MVVACSRMVSIAWAKLLSELSAVPKFPLFRASESSVSTYVSFPPSAESRTLRATRIPPISTISMTAVMMILEKLFRFFPSETLPSSSVTGSSHSRRSWSRLSSRSVIEVTFGFTALDTGFPGADFCGLCTTLCTFAVFCTVFFAVSPGERFSVCTDTCPEFFRA